MANEASRERGACLRVGLALPAHFFKTASGRRCHALRRRNIQHAYTPWDHNTTTIAIKIKNVQMFGSRQPSTYDMAHI